MTHPSVGNSITGLSLVPHLSIEEETFFANFLIKSAKIGYPRTVSQVLGYVQQIFQSKGLGMLSVSDGWWQKFCERHPELSLRTAVPLSLPLAMATGYDVLQKYFDILEDTLSKNLLFNNASRIFSCNETVLQLNPAESSRQGAKNECNSQISVLASTCATGITLPPFIIFDHKSRNFQLMSGEVPGTLFGSSTNGLIDQELFILWFRKLFLMTVPKVRPLLLIMDGHSSHYNPNFIRIAAKEQILIFVFPPSTTHLTQPLDKGCFGPLKTAWKAVCHEFYCKNPGRVVSRYDFAALFNEAWRRAMTQKNVTGGFKVTGIYPFNRNALKVQDHHGKQEGLSLLQETGLAYIPMYSADDEERRSSSNLSLEDEPPQLERSLSEGDLSRALTPLRRRTAVESLLVTLPHPSSASTKPTKSISVCGRVRTYSEQIETEGMKVEDKRNNKEKKAGKDEFEKGANSAKRLKRVEGLMKNTNTGTRKWERAKEVGIVGGKRLCVTKMNTRSKDCERLESTSFGIYKSSCAEKLCSHPKATNWVSCYSCKQWYHCICYKIPYSIAKTKTFTFICNFCK